jgi:hypothetical protein
MKWLRHTNLYDLLDIVLASQVSIGKLHPSLASKAVCESTPPNEVVKKLATATIIFIHPDGFDHWTDVLLQLQQHRPLPAKLFIIADSDFAFDEGHMEAMVGLFPDAQFWIQNYYGDRKQTRLFPLGVNESIEIEQVPKTKALGISYLSFYYNNLHRQNFFSFLLAKPEMESHYLPKTDYPTFCSNLSECFFSTCPMGEGYDTYRFWESLMVGAIPIVKSHPFYKELREKYPGIPFVEVDSWEHIVSLLPALTPEYYESLWKKRDLTCLDEDIWRSQILAMLPTSAENRGSNFQLT